MRFCTKKLTSTLLAAITILIVPFPAMAESQIIHVSAAANLSEALKTIGENFKKTRPDIELQFNFGSSGSLAKQIDNGAPADLFFSANAKWMNYLVETKKIIKETVRDITGNSLVVVSLKATPLQSLTDINSFQRIAMGSPGSVPVGDYTEQALKAAGLYGFLTSANKLIMTKDVRQALLYADRGEADIAFVYKTDALLAKNAKIVFTIPAEFHKPIVSSMGLTMEGKDSAGAKAFYDFMDSDNVQSVLESFGYTVIEPKGKK